MRMVVMQLELTMNMMQLKYIPARRRNDNNDFRDVGVLTYQ